MKANGRRGSLFLGSGAASTRASCSLRVLSHYNPPVYTSTIANSVQIFTSLRRSYADPPQNPLTGKASPFKSPFEKSSGSSSIFNSDSASTLGSIWKGKAELERERIDDVVGEYAFFEDADMEEEFDDFAEEDEFDNAAKYDQTPYWGEDEGAAPTEPDQIDWETPAREDAMDMLQEEGDSMEELQSDDHWHRDFSQTNSAEAAPDEEKDSVASLPTSWFRHAPHDAIVPEEPARSAELGTSADDEGFETVVYMGRHTKVTKGGRMFTFSAMVVDGDGEGTAGYGYGRGDEIYLAIDAARKDLRKRLIHIDRFENRTLAMNTRAKYGKSICQLFVYPNRGVWIPRSSLPMEAVFRAFGLENVAGKFIGSRNRKNCIKALFKAIQLSEHPAQTAMNLGVKWFNPANVWRKGQPRVWTY